MSVFKHSFKDECFFWLVCSLSDLASLVVDLATSGGDLATSAGNLATPGGDLATSVVNFAIMHVSGVGTYDVTVVK